MQLKKEWNPKFTKDEQEEYHEDIAKFYQKTFGTPEGIIVLQDLIDKFFGYKQKLFDKNPIAMAYNVGGREVLAYIERLLKIEVKNPNARRNTTRKVNQRFSKRVGGTTAGDSGVTE